MVLLFYGWSTMYCIQLSRNALHSLNTLLLKAYFLSYSLTPFAIYSESSLNFWFSEIYVLYALNLSMQLVNIWYNLVHKWQICKPKLRWLIPPPKFSEPPSSETIGRMQKVKVGRKMVRTCSTHMPSLVPICRRMAERGKNGCFYRLGNHRY